MGSICHIAESSQGSSNVHLDHALLQLGRQGTSHAIPPNVFHQLAVCGSFLVIADEEVEEEAEDVSEEAVTFRELVTARTQESGAGLT